MVAGPEAVLLDGFAFFCGFETFLRPGGAERLRRVTRHGCRRTAEWRCCKSIPIGKRPEGTYAGLAKKAARKPEAGAVAPPNGGTVNQFQSANGTKGRMLKAGEQTRAGEKI